ncbi:hypothetical protein J5N97_003570 [Dioscorea zingiberensis]|uniref:X8 domain-containing protein n=1 Tax=Dioscorea zingiberensis TaxID=325984 RepID=A0A9D5D5R3_9LILI|nr:hypothetical protein J5N97_003570 [Dioscorea zingiberensis]
MGCLSLLVLGVACWACLVNYVYASGIGANWGTQTSHPLPPSVVVQLLRDNGFQKVKIFDAEEPTLNALKKTGIQVMVGIPNDMLATLASNFKAAEKWVSKNVSGFVSDGVDIRYVAVGNEPFLETYNGSFLQTTFPALQNIQAALIKAGVTDGNAIYSNMFDANYDTLIWALQKNGFGNLPVIVGEIGWPTDGDMNANLQYAQQFNQGFMNHISTERGTPMRPGSIDAYLFSLIDEDEKSIQPGNFERHWGIFSYDGSPKYQLNLKTTKSGALMRAHYVKYLDKQWCVLKPSVSLNDPKVAPSISYACGNADCTSLGYKTSCGNMDARGNISYAFNSFYQKSDQQDVACGFDGIATITNRDPSTESCRFKIMVDVDSATPFKEQGLCFLLVFLCFAFLFDMPLLV